MVEGRKAKYYLHERRDPITGEVVERDCSITIDGLLEDESGLVSKATGRFFTDDELEKMLAQRDAVEWNAAIDAAAEEAADGNDGGLVGRILALKKEPTT